LRTGARSWLAPSGGGGGFRVIWPLKEGHLAHNERQGAGVTAPQTYVHHCHIVEHEDNDMMLPFIVEP
jgi:FtsP/CotA-like multicopper oxidase with cupredoxin domain